MQCTVLHMKRLNQTESPIFVILCVLCFQRQPSLTFILGHGVTNLVYENEEPFPGLQDKWVASSETVASNMRKMHILRPFCAWSKYY